MSMIDQYAVEKLGMTKMKSNQIKYIDVSQYKQKTSCCRTGSFKAKTGKIQG